MAQDLNPNTSIDLDLNYPPPVEDYVTEGTFLTMNLLNDRGKAALTIDSQGGHSSEQEQALLTPQDGKEGMPPIDVENIDDELVLLSHPINFPQARSWCKRNKRAVIVIDEDINGSENEVDLELAISLFDDHKQAKNAYPVNSANGKSYTCELDFVNEKGSSSTNVNAVQFLEVPEPPKDSSFNCPICLQPILDACSTVCGHIFCEKCINKSVKKMKKCPTCRRKLTNSKYHRIYLPDA